MFGFQRLNSTRNMFVNSYVRNLQEVLRFATYKLPVCIQKRNNVVLISIASSGESIVSSMRYSWNIILYTLCFLFKTTFCIIF